MTCHAITRLALGYRNESFIPYFPGAYSPQDEEEVKSKDINIIQWGKYLRTSKYWVQWGSRVLGCLGSLFIRAMKTAWKEIYCVCVFVCVYVCVCVCVCVCSCAHLQGCILYVCLYWIHWSTKYRDNSCPTILIQLHAITCWKPENEETDFRPGCNSITEQQKKESTNKGWSCMFTNESMQLIKTFRLFQMPMPTEVKVQETAWRG